MLGFISLVVLGGSLLGLRLIAQKAEKTHTERILRKSTSFSLLFCMFFAVFYGLRLFTGNPEASALAEVPPFNLVARQIASIEGMLKGQERAAERFAKDTLTEAEKRTKEAGVKEIPISDPQALLDRCDTALQGLDPEKNRLVYAKLLIKKAEIQLLWSMSDYASSIERLSGARMALSFAREVAGRDANDLEGLIAGNEGTSYLLEADIRKKRENIEKAIPLLERSIPLLSGREEEQAVQSQNLGNSYVALAEECRSSRERIECLNKAIETLSPVMKSKWAKSSPSRLATVTNGLAMAYRQRANESKSLPDVEEAIRLYRAGMGTLDLEKDGARYALLNANLVTALLQKYELKPSLEVLEEASSNYRKGMLFMDREREKDVLANLSASYAAVALRLGKMKNEDVFFREAVSLYEKVLSIYTPRQSLQRYLHFSNNLAATLLMSRESGDRTARLKTAAQRLEEGLQFLDPKSKPELYGITQENLAACYVALSRGKEARPYLGKAQKALEGSLAVFTEKDFPGERASVLKTLKMIQIMQVGL